MSDSSAPQATGHRSEPVLIEKSVRGRRGVRPPSPQGPLGPLEEMLPGVELRTDLPLPELSELDVVRHYTALSRRNYGIDAGFYPLGSCTMKYNPRANECAARSPGWARLHPLTPPAAVQGALQLMYELNCFLAEVAGMAAATIQPAAGAHGETLSLMMVRAYHRSRGDMERTSVLIPDSAHGTNPASAALCGFQVRPITSDADGLSDTRHLRELVGADTAAVMLTNPNTLGLFESRIAEICAVVHDAGGLVYCDGANMNALLGVARPGEMGFDVMHFNLHKTFGTPHGGGGPGCGAIAVGSVLEPFLPVPVVVRRGNALYDLCHDRPLSVGRVHSFYGAFLNAVRGYAYIRSLGPDGLREVARHAVLNANYVRARIGGAYEIPHNRLCMHEVVASASRLKRRFGVRAMDVSKRLMDHGFHPPTNYFPLIVSEALMIEPTETESKQTIDAFCDALIAIAAEAETDPEVVRGAPYSTPVRRPDETAAVKRLDVRWGSSGQ
ncbi:MAG TPA: aminomethyl-transferring glycine dehydrogenase subunit GcvPB [Chthonomonadales bacterium]|nr:aminomethyl-transferring glycine dehydrogenase subunit GcvPB [Chthonomonadales bacterium]